MGVKHLEAKVNPRLKEQDEELIIRSQREPQERDACQELQLFIRRCSHPQTEVWWGGKGGGANASTALGSHVRSMPNQMGRQRVRGLIDTVRKCRPLGKQLAEGWRADLMGKWVKASVAIFGEA